MKNLNFRLILNIIGLVLIFEGLFLLMDLVVCFIYDKSSIPAIFKSILITGCLGFILFISTKKNLKKEPGRSESFLVVTLSWLVITLFGALPFILSHSIQNFINAFFESVSGFTTTGASILTDIESVPKGILFWRSETHWVGGMGIIVMMLAIFPYFKIGGLHLLESESSNVIFEKIKPKLIDTAKRLWLIYILLTIAEIILLKLGGMNIFDSICHTFSTVATGGFSTKNTSISEYSIYIQYVILIFMLLSGINYTLYYFVLKRKAKKLFRNEELRLYLTIILIAGSLITINLLIKGLPFEKSFRDSFFTVISIISSTGFCTADYLLWPKFVIALIFFLMFLGGCSGSSSGGIKVVRHLIALKNIRYQIKSILHPSMIKKIKYNLSPISNSQLRIIQSFILIYISVFAIGTILMITLGVDFYTAAGSVATTLGGIGPGLGSVGPSGNYAMIPDLGKLLLCAMMILGRLEILSVLVIFTPSFWRI